MHEYAEQMSRSFEDELQKIAAKKVASNWMLPAVAGGLITAAAVRAEQDRRLGRRLRAQSSR